MASAIGGLAGATLQSRLGSTVLTLVLATLLVLAGSSELARRPVPLPQTPFWRLVGGVLSGIFGGLVGNQGGIRAAALLGFQLPARPLVATATAAALLVDMARVPITSCRRLSHPWGHEAVAHCLSRRDDRYLCRCAGP
ncbi:MAG: TSUP family transporter [Gemmatimonadales bacterium]